MSRHTIKDIALVAVLATLSAFPVLAGDALAQGADGLVAIEPAVRNVNLVGFTRARRVVGIVSEEAGRVLSVGADIGEPIGKDGVFAKLDTTFINLEIAANQTSQKQLQSEIKYLLKETKRRYSLLKKKTVSQSVVDEFQQKLDQARLRLQALEVEEKNLKERRKRFRIPAMPGSLVMERAVEPGKWVTTGETLGKVGEYKTLLIPFALTAAEFDALKKTENLCVVLPDINPALGEEPDPTLPQGGLCVDARIERVSPEFDPETRKINVDLAVDQGLTLRRGGLRSVLSLSMPDPSGTLMVPEGAVQARYEEHFVQRPDGTRVRVQYLKTEDGMARIRSRELEPGDLIRAMPGETAGQGS